jgi:hypothetical protein
MSYLSRSWKQLQSEQLIQLKTCPHLRFAGSLATNNYLLLACLRMLYQLQQFNGKTNQKYNYQKQQQRTEASILLTARIKSYKVDECLDVRLHILNCIHSAYNRLLAFRLMSHHVNIAGHIREDHYWLECASWDSCYLVSSWKRQNFVPCEHGDIFHNSMPTQTVTNTLKRAALSGESETFDVAYQPERWRCFGWSDGMGRHLTWESFPIPRLSWPARVNHSNSMNTLVHITWH